MTPLTNTRKTRLTLASSQVPPVQAPKPRRATKPELKTDELFVGTREIHILHNEDTYRLSITKQGKLILTK
ncbi:hemin uptake protein HemP [Roseibium denhamense]|uniref:Hemin uptake protein HemP n=1 Tax=Roseibium denhamense TaxID=76305 RepID=A0ABY1P2A9_9HYPH|nr:hemin uptake protein HemP [Roseibium denhamense]MTI07551.1 hemin uptake protein HemP [Roseibium denhamense]SMP23856.1 Hemin uptake protein HemP [Roseibium denhamense]